MIRSIIILVVCAICISCSTIQLKPNEESWILQIDSSRVSSAEFEYMLTKNQSDSTFSKQDIDDYLELYTNFKLKVRQARIEGYDTISSLREEFEGYKRQLLRPYMNLNGIDDSILFQAYKRSLTEIRASHILIDFNDRTESEALRKILDIREQALKGQDFGTLAQQYSEDPSAKINKGDLGYFSAFRMVLPFELAAYETQVGSVSSPVRTQFGYHIIRVTDRRPAREQLKLAHILVREQNEGKAKEKIFRISGLLKQGEPWDNVCAQYSDDFNTRTKGGVLPWISSGQTAPQFEDVAYSLDSGEVSEPTKTPYGWHLIKLIDKKGIGNFDSQKSLIEQKLRRNNSESLDEFELMEILKKRFKFSQNDSVVFNLLADLPPDEDSVLFTLSNQVVSIKLYQEYLSEVDNEANLATYNDFVFHKLQELEENRISKDNPEVPFLVREYDEGLLLFEIMDDKVWSKAVQDSLGLKTYFERNRNKYKRDSSARVALLSPDTEDTELLQRLSKDLLIVSPKADSLKAFARQNNLIFEESLLSVRDPLIESMTDEKKIRIVNTEGLLAIVILESVEGEDLELMNIRGQVITDYQNYLDEGWIDKLRSDAEIIINEKELERVYARYAR